MKKTETMFLSDGTSVYPISDLKNSFHISITVYIYNIICYCYIAATNCSIPLLWKLKSLSFFFKIFYELFGTAVSRKINRHKILRGFLILSFYKTFTLIAFVIIWLLIKMSTIKYSWLMHYAYLFWCHTGYKQMLVFCDSNEYHLTY